jgi:hypothetical protein
MLLAKEEIAQDHKHHEEHDGDDQAAEQKTHEVTGRGSRHGQFPSVSKDLGGFVLSSESYAYAPKCLAT